MKHSGDPDPKFWEGQQSTNEALATGVIFNIIHSSKHMSPIPLKALPKNGRVDTNFEINYINSIFTFMLYMYFFERFDQLNYTPGILRWQTYFWNEKISYRWSGSLRTFMLYLFPVKLCSDTRGGTASIKWKHFQVSEISQFSMINIACSVRSVALRK